MKIEGNFGTVPSAEVKKEFERTENLASQLTSVVIPELEALEKVEGASQLVFALRELINFPKDLLVLDNALSERGYSYLIFRPFSGEIQSPEVTEAIKVMLQAKSRIDKEAAAKEIAKLIKE